MKYSIEATVEGELFLEDPNVTVAIDRPDVRYEFRSDEKARLTTIAVISTMSDAAAVTSHATFGPKPDDPRQAPPLTVDVDHDADVAARRHLLTVESVLSYATDDGNPLIGVNAWEGAMILMPETPEERARVQIDRISVKRTVRRRPSTVTQRFLADVIVGTGRYGDLIEPMAFLRDGTNRQLAGEFIQAFYAYYFIIEGLYAGGRSSGPEILKSFAESQLFAVTCQTVVNSYFGPNTPRKKQVSVLRPLMTDYRCPETAEGLQRFLVRMRQQLHHFSRRSTKLQPHPFNQQAFEPLADLTRFVAKVSIERERLKIESLQE